jgi:hypothetical protein
MSLRYFTGFQQVGNGNNVAPYGWRGGSGNAGNSSARYTGSLAYIGSSKIWRPVAGMGKLVTWGWATRYDSTSFGTRRPAIGLLSGAMSGDGNAHLCVEMAGNDALGDIRVRLDPNGTDDLLLTHNSITTTHGNWRYYEMQAFLDDVDGFVRIREYRLDEQVADSEAVGIDTVGALSDDEFTGITVAGFPESMRFNHITDIYVRDDDLRLGAVRTQVRKGTADGDHDDWAGDDGGTPVTDDKYLLVQDGDPDTRIVTDGDGNRQSIVTDEFRDVFSAAPFVAAVQVAAIVESPGASEQDANLFLRKDATDFDGDPQVAPAPVGPSTQVEHIYEADPDTSMPWTIGALNAYDEHGIRKLDP